MSAPVRIVMMGTPEFAVPTLQTLHAQAAAHGWEVVAVVTQPDRPAGRGQKLVASPVKEQALAAELPVLQPATLRKDPAAVTALAELAADIFVVAAYGLILPKRVLTLPTYGCLNVHASLLPAYRGASPIAAAMLDGRAETGVSIMLMDEGMDTGPVLAQARQPIAADDTTATLAARLAAQGAALLAATLPGWVAGTVAPVAQDELPGEPSVCRLIRKEDGVIDWTLPAARIERMTRAYAPWPSAYTVWRGAPLKVWQAAARPGQAAPGAVAAPPAGAAGGPGDGLLLLQSGQPAGKRAMDAASLVNGAPDFVGSRLG